MGKTVKVGKGFKPTISGTSGLFTQQTSFQTRNYSLANPGSSQFQNLNQTTSKILENVLSRKFTTSKETEDEALRKMEKQPSKVPDYMYDPLMKDRSSDISE